jgi:hypothetical protein
VSTEAVATDQPRVLADPTGRFPANAERSAEPASTANVEAVQELACSERA